MPGPRNGRTTDVPGFPVDAVDTNGAGDTHCGVLAAELLRGRSTSWWRPRHDRYPQARGGDQRPRRDRRRRAPRDATPAVLALVRRERLGAGAELRLVHPRLRHLVLAG